MHVPFTVCQVFTELPGEMQVPEERRPSLQTGLTRVIEPHPVFLPNRPSFEIICFSLPDFHSLRTPEEKQALCLETSNCRMLTWQLLSYNVYDNPSNTRVSSLYHL